MAHGIVIGGWLQVEPCSFGLALQQAATDALADRLNQGRQFRALRCFHAVEARRAVVSGDVDAIQEKDVTNRQDSRFAQAKLAPKGSDTGMYPMQVDIRIECGPKALLQVDCSGVRKISSYLSQYSGVWGG